jgi:hypothetical protein
MDYNTPSLRKGLLRLGIWHWVADWPSLHEGEKERQRGWMNHNHGG